MKTRDMTLISLFTALMIAGAFIKLRLPFLSVTFQGFFAILAGPILGPKKASISMVLYMLLGLFGLPVFSDGGGIGYVLLPSFGFIIGFIPGAVVSGVLFKKIHSSNFIKGLISSISGTAVIYLIGIPYMYAIFNYYMNKPEYTIAAIVTSMAVYVLKDIILSVVAAVILKNNHLTNLT